MALGANALITADEMMAFLKPSDADVAVCEKIVDGVSEFFNSYTRWTLRSTVYTGLELCGNGGTLIWLPNAPLTVVSSLKLDGVALIAGTLYDYVADAASGKLTKVSGVWTVGINNILITYTAGWTAALMPADLKLACLKQSAHDYAKWQSRSWGESSHSQAGGSISVNEQDLLPGLEKILDLYVRMPS